MNRNELITWLKGVMSGKVKVKKHTFKLDNGQLFLSVKNAWLPISKADFIKLTHNATPMNPDFFICDKNENTADFKIPGIIFLRGDPEYSDIYKNLIYKLQSGKNEFTYSI